MVQRSSTSRVFARYFPTRTLSRASRLRCGVALKAPHKENSAYAPKIPAHPLINH